MSRILIPLATLLLSACSAELAGTAAVNATAKGQEARQAQQTLGNVQNKLDAAARADQERATEADKVVSY